MWKVLAEISFTLLICLVNPFESSSCRGELGSHHRSQSCLRRQRPYRAACGKQPSTQPAHMEIERPQVCVFGSLCSSQKTSFFLRTFFFNVDLFFSKSLLNFLQYCFCFMFCFFGLQGMWYLSSMTRN